MSKGYHLSVDGSRLRRHRREPGMATGMLHRAAEDLAELAIPFADDVFAVGCDDAAVRDVLAEVLLGGHSEFWGSYESMRRAFQQFVGILIGDGRAFSEVVLENGEPVAIEYLEASTMFQRRSRGQRTCEQYIPRTRGGGSFYCRFTQDEVFALTWPLSEPKGKVPYEAGLRAARDTARLSSEGHLSRSGILNAKETYLWNVLGRNGWFDDADTRMFEAIDKAADCLFYPPEKNVTDYFWVQRVSRQRAAACRLRDYLLRQFNEQVLHLWCSARRVPQAELVYRPAVLSAIEWDEVPAQFLSGQLSKGDIPLLIELEDQAARVFDDRWV